MTQNQTQATAIPSTGNRCGHDPEKPDLTLARPIKMKTATTGFPLILKTAIERMQKYYARPSLFPSLNHANQYYNAKTLKNTKARQQRTERREACVKVLASILKRVDLVTMIVGVPERAGFRPLGWKTIVLDTGLTATRVKRAVRDLKAAGLLTSSPLREWDEATGRYINLYSIKAVSVSLFAMLGLSNQLKKDRKHASKQRKKHATPINDAPVSELDRTRNGLRLAAIGRAATTPPRQAKKSTDSAKIEKKSGPVPLSELTRAQRESVERLALSLLMDGVPSSECREEARRRLNV